VHDDISSLLVTKRLFKVKLRVLVIKQLRIVKKSKIFRSYPVPQGKSQKEGNVVQKCCEASGKFA
jgi:hypothetical protein